MDGRKGKKGGGPDTEAPSVDSDNGSLFDLLKIVSFLKPFKWSFFALLGVVFAINFTQLARPYIFGQALNGLQALKEAGELPASRTEVIKYVIIPTAEYLALGFLSAVFFKLNPLVSMGLSVSLLRRLRTMVYSRIQHLSFDHLDRLTNGQLIERAIGDVNQIRIFLTGSFVQMFDATVTAVLMIFFMHKMSPWITYVALAPMPLVVYLFGRINGKIRVSSRRVRDEVDVMTSRLTEGIEGVKVIRSFGAENRTVDRYREVVIRVFKRAMTVGKIRSFGLMSMFHTTRLLEVMLLAFGGVAVIYHQVSDGGVDSMEIGSLVAYLFYVRMLIWKIVPLMDAAAMAQDARAAFERIVALVEVEGLIEEKSDAIDLPDGKGELVFDNVSFAYQPAPAEHSDVTERMQIVRPSPTPSAIEAVNLRVPAGTTVALIGPTGSGKSTLVNMLPRFYDPTKGSISIDGADLRDLKLEELRNNIGFVFQETMLFRGTIGENISFGCNWASDSDIRRASKLAQAHDFISELPMGYDSLIGERGVSLSGGQRQRIAIARAILMDPRILILDDATAAIDPTTEYRIRQGLKELMRGRTSIVIAHRLATIRSAQMVVVINDGRIEDVGTHDQLSQRNQFYRDLLETQSLLNGDEPLEGTDQEGK